MFQQHLADKEAKRLEKEEKMRLHKEMLERERKEKQEKLDRKINNAEYLK